MKNSKPGMIPWVAAGLTMFWALLSGGCASPGQIEPGLLTRYQKSLEERPRSRASDQGLGLLRPEDGASPLKAVQDTLTDLQGVELPLEEAVRMALRNSPDIRVVGFDPAISREDMVKAAAAFDFVLFGGLSQTRTDHRPSSIVGGGKQRVIPFEVGVREHAPIGTDLQLTWDITRTADNSLYSRPQPRYESMLSLTATHPLLRGGGLDYNLAALRVATLGTRVSYSRFRQRVEEIITAVRVGYWSLLQARRELAIQKELLDKTIETLERVRKRRDLDATEVEIKQAEAAVETRRAVLVRARKVIFDVQDQLVRLLADARLNLVGKVAVVPTTPAVASPVTLDGTDQLVTALRFSPLLEQARLGIATADIQVGVAKNETLPALNLTAGTAIDGLESNLSNGVRDMSRFNYIDYSIGLVYEYPLGNRAAEAALRQRRWERLKAIADMQSIADQVAIAVNEGIRQVQTTYEEMKAQQAAKEASRVQLQALEDTERIRGRLTPEFLQVKLQAQETLAAAERGEVEALVNFNNALAQLAQVTGTVLREHNIQLAVESASEYRPGPQAPWPETTAGPSTARGTAPTSTSAMRPGSLPASRPR